MSDEADAYWTRTGDGGCMPLRHCSGAWNPDELHISPVNGLLLHELERRLATPAYVGKQIVRVSFDYLGPIDFAPCSVEFDPLRPGRSIDLVEAVLSQHGRPVLRARIWLLATGDTTAVVGGEREPLPAPDTARSVAVDAIWPGDYIRSLDIRAVHGPTPGHSIAWLTTPLSIVAGEPTSDLARFVLLVDTANGIAVRQPPEQWHYPNVDLTIHLFRQPTGAWTGFDTRVTFGPTGHGLTSSDLYDVDGHVGRAEQILLVRPR